MTKEPGNTVVPARFSLLWSCSAAEFAQTITVEPVNMKTECSKAPSLSCKIEAWDATHPRERRKTVRAIETSIEAKIQEVRGRIESKDDSTDSYDSSYLDYLEDSKALLQEDGEEGLRTHLLEELPHLKEREDEEATLRRFDWYDDHFYEKIAMGRKNACKFILGLFDR